MKLLEPLLKRFSRKGTNPTLVFEFNGFQLKGALAEQVDSEFKIVDFAESIKPSVDECLEEVMGALRSRNPKLPVEALLVTSQAAATILELPLSPQTPFKRAEVQELVRWEFEQQLAEQTSALTLDTVLVGRRLMTEEDVDEARAQLLEENSGSISVHSAPTKFAEQAVKMGFVKRADVEDSVKVLENYFVQDDEPSCNFFALAEEGDAPGEAGFPWLVCGIGQQIQMGWVGRFANYDIRLERIYPAGFVSCAAIETPVNVKHYGILDLLEGVDCYASYNGDRLTTLRWGAAPLSARNPEALVNLVGADRLENLWLSGETRVVKPVATAITQELQVGVRMFSRPPTGPTLNGNVASVRFDGMIGALRHTAELTEQSVPWVDGAGPRPPWYKQSSKWWMVVGGLLTFIILTSEITLGVQRQSVKWALDQITTQVDSVKSEIAKVQGTAKEANQLQAAIEDDESDLQVKSDALNLLSDGLRLRSEYANALFLALANSVTPNVAVNEFREERDHRIVLEAWALTEREAQHFIHLLVEALSPWGMDLSLQQVRQKAGRLGLSGYHIQIDLTPNPVYPKKEKS